MKVVGTEEAEGEESKVVVEVVTEEGVTKVVVVEAVMMVLKNVVVDVVLVLSEDSLDKLLVSDSVGRGAIPKVAVEFETSEERLLEENVLTGPVGVTSGTTTVLVVGTGAELKSEEDTEEACEMTDEIEERTDEELDSAEELDREEATEEIDEDTDEAELAAEDRLLVVDAGAESKSEEDVEEACERTDEELDSAEELDREEATEEIDEDTDEAELAAEDRLLASVVMALTWHEARGMKAAADRIKVLEYMMVVIVDRGTKKIVDVKFVFDD